MLASLPLPALIVLFLLASGAVWAAGSRLAKATDALSERLGLGHALGGLLILAVATNLPELAIVVSAARERHYELIAGNLLGSIAAQTAVLAVIDLMVNRPGGSLTTRAASLELVLEGVLVMAMLAVIVMATQLPGTMLFHFTTPSGLLILLGWGVGIALLNQARHGLPWDVSPEHPAPQDEPKDEGPMRHALPIFLLAAAVTLAGGVALEQTGEGIAERLHIGGLVFGATALAAVGALPEFSSCLAAARRGQETLAVSDVLGGHVFLPVLFVVGTAVADHSILSHSDRANVYLTALGIVMTAVFVYGLIFRPKRQVGKMGIDSFVVLLLYALGMVGLVVLAKP